METNEGTNSTLRPAWIRVPLAMHLFGISRSSLYELIAENKIKSASIRKRNALRGIRLINVDSLEEYLNGFVQSKGLN